MRRSILTVALGALLFAVPSAHAADDPLLEQVKSQIAYFKKNAKRMKDYATWANAIVEMADTGHSKAAEFLGQRLLKDQDIEHQMILGASLADFRTAKKEGKDAAGKSLRTALVKGKKFEIDVKDTIVDSLGKLEYQPATLDVCAVLKKGGDPWLLLTCVRALGRINDKRALPTLLELWERHPVGYSWETGEVTVDTGAAGTADQEAAEAQWQAKYGNQMKAKSKPPVMFKVYIEELVRTVAKICGEEIETAQGLREWMEANRDELKALGVDIPKYKGGKKKEKKDKDEK